MTDTATTRRHRADLYCPYCCARFTPANAAQTCCTPACAKRNGQWNRWVAQTRAAAVYGQKGPAFPVGAALTAAVAPYRVEAEAVAA